MSLRRLSLAFSLALAVSPVGIAAAQTPAPAVQNRELARLTLDYREDQLKHSPELASSLGDRRYNDQLSDLSPREANARLERGRGFLVRLAGIDLGGLSAQDRAVATQLQVELIAEQSAGQTKAWQMQFDPATGVQARLAELPRHIPLETAKDFDDYIARLKKIPDQLRQASTDLQLGLDEGRPLPAEAIAKAAAQANEIASKTPQASPFAAPLERFPANFTPAQKARISEETLQAIQDDVLPAYARLGRFLNAQLPASK